MKFTLPILALVASAYCAPISQPASALGGAIAPPTALTRAVSAHAAAVKRAATQQGGPTFFDAGDPTTNPDTVKSKNLASSSSAQPAASAPASLGQVGEEVGAALGNTLKPVLDPVLSLTNSLDITKRAVHHAGTVPTTPPPAFGQPTSQNPSPNSVAPKGQVPKSGPTMSGDGTVKSQPVISASINIKDRDIEAERRDAAIVMKNGIVASMAQGLGEKRDAAVVLKSGLVGSVAQGETEKRDVAVVLKSGLVGSVSQTESEKRDAAVVLKSGLVGSVSQDQSN